MVISLVSFHLLLRFLGKILFNPTLSPNLLNGRNGFAHIVVMMMQGHPDTK